MKKNIFITIILFLVSTVLQQVLSFIINEQVISRILYGVDYNTYFMEYYSGSSGMIKMISGSSIPYEWVFSISNFIIAIVCVIIIFLIIKKLKTKYTITKKDFTIIMILFSTLSLYNVFLYIVMFYNIPPIKSFVWPILFIISAYVGIYKMMYLKSNKDNT